MSLNNLLHVAENEVRVNYNVKIIRYDDNQIDVIKYDNLVSRFKDGFVECESKTSKLIDIDFQSNIDNTVPTDSDKHRTIEKSSINRSKARLLEIAKANRSELKSFITLTYADIVSDLDYANKQFNIWRTQVKRSFSDFLYICVPEYQKRGSIHYHLLTNIPCNHKLLPKQKDKKTMYDVKYWKHGFTSAFDIVNDVDSNFKLELYISKYLYKDFDDRFFGHNKFFYSQNCKKPTYEYIYLDDKQYNDLLLQFDDFKKEEKNYYPTKKFAIPMKINIFNKNI